MKIGFYRGNIFNTKEAQPITIGEFVNFIKYEKFKAKADKIAAIADKKQQAEAKAKTLEYVTISGLFSERSEKGILEHSGLIAVDIDGVKSIEDTKAALSRDPYSFVVFKSVSGNGLCVIIKTTPNVDSHKDHFRWIEQYYYDQFSLSIDASCKDVSRARFISCDKDIVVNENSKRAGKKPLQKAKTKTINWIASDNQMNRIVSDIVNSQINIADSYQDFLTCAFAIADGYGEGGRQYFHGVASVSDKYNGDQADKKYTNALNTGSGKIKIGSFFHLCQQAGIELRTKEEKTAFAIAKAAKLNKSDIKGAIQTAEASGVDTKLVEDIAAKVFERDDIDLTDKDISIIEAMGALIKMNTSLRLNTLTMCVENEGKDIDDVFINTIYLNTKIQLGSEVRKSDIEAIINSDMTPSYNPLLDWIAEHEHLPHDPGIIDRFISAIPFKDPRAASFVRSWLLGIPASIRGEVVRLVLCFVGKQETGKTHWFRNFLPKALMRYYADSDLMHSGDDAQIMASNIVAMDDELGGKSARDSQKFKELTSKDVFSLRLPYGRTVVKLKRLAMLCGTTNDFQIINDSTGNTRMLPVEFNEKYNFELYNSIDKDQLFMEIWRASERGESWKLTDEAAETLQELSAGYSIADYEGELIDTYLDVPSTSIGGVFMSTTEIKIYLEQSSGQKIMSPKKLGVALKNRFGQEIRKINGKSKRGYTCVTLKCNHSTPHNPYDNQVVDRPF